MQIQSAGRTDRCNRQFKYIHFAQWHEQCHVDLRYFNSF